MAGSSAGESSTAAPSVTTYSASHVSSKLDAEAWDTRLAMWRLATEAAARKTAAGSSLQLQTCGSCTGADCGLECELTGPTKVPCFGVMSFCCSETSKMRTVQRT